MNVLLVVVPRYGAYTMTLTGWTMLFACSLYYWLLPKKPLEIHFEEAVIQFKLGWCFWINIVTGNQRQMTSEVRALLRICIRTYSILIA